MSLDLIEDDRELDVDDKEELTMENVPKAVNYLVMRLLRCGLHWKTLNPD